MSNTLIELLLEECQWFDRQAQAVARLLAVTDVAALEAVSPGLTEILEDLADYGEIPTLPSGQPKPSQEHRLVSIEEMAVIPFSSRVA